MLQLFYFSIVLLFTSRGFTQKKNFFSFFFRRVCATQTTLLYSKEQTCSLVVVAASTSNLCDVDRLHNTKLCYSESLQLRKSQATTRHFIFFSPPSTLRYNFPSCIYTYFFFFASYTTIIFLFLFCSFRQYDCDEGLSLVINK